MTPQCQCLSPDGGCGNSKHTALLCTEPGSVNVMSRDWDEGVYSFCTWCAISARASKIFVGVPNAG